MCSSSKIFWPGSMVAHDVGEANMRGKQSHSGAFSDSAGVVGKCLTLWQFVSSPHITYAGMGRGVALKTATKRAPKRKSARPGKRAPTLLFQPATTFLTLDTESIPAGAASPKNAARLLHKRTREMTQARPAASDLDAPKRLQSINP